MPDTYSHVYALEKILCLPQISPAVDPLTLRDRQKWRSRQNGQAGCRGWARKCTTEMKTIIKSLYRPQQPRDPELSSAAQTRPSSHFSPQDRAQQAAASSAQKVAPCAAPQVPMWKSKPDCRTHLTGLQEFQHPEGPHPCTTSCTTQWRLYRRPPASSQELVFKCNQANDTRRRKYSD